MIIKPLETRSGSFLLVFSLVLLQLIPIHWQLGLPLPKVIPSALCLSFIAYIYIKQVFTQKVARLKIASIPVLLLISLMLISSILFALTVDTSSKDYLQTAFVLSIQAVIPISYYFLPNMLRPKDTEKSLALISCMYLLFGFAVSVALVWLSSNIGSSEQFRDIPIILSKLQSETSDTSSSISLLSLYTYFGRSNTIGPTISLSLVPVIAFLFCNARANTSVRITCVILLVLGICIITVLNSRASLVAVIVSVAVLLISRFLTRPSFLYSLGFISLVFLVIIVFAIVGIDESFTLSSFQSDGRFEIIRGVLGSGNLNTLFGQGIASAPYFCAVSPSAYARVYDTSFCTFHNAFLTALHDTGIAGFLVFSYLVIRPSFGYSKRFFSSISSIHETRSSKRTTVRESELRLIDAFGLALATSSVTLLFFDSDILFVHPVFSALFWYLQGSYSLISRQSNR